MTAVVDLDWRHQYRIIPSEYPAINFFERLVDPALMVELYYVESLTNDRLRQQVGDIFLVPDEDRIWMPWLLRPGISCPWTPTEGWSSGKDPSPA